MIGLAVVALCFGYLAYTLRETFGTLPSVQWSAGAVAAVAGALGLYGAALCLWGVGWTILVRSFGQNSTFRAGVTTVLSTQIAKYLPGNVGQHIGRVVVAGRFGISTGPAVAAVANELAWIVAAAGGIALLAIAVSGRSFIDLDIPAAAIAAIVIAAIAFAALAPNVIVGWRSASGVNGPDPVVRVPWAAGGINLAIHVASFLLHGAALWLLASGLFGRPLDYWIAVQSFSLAFLAGFLAPGVPAGLGVREAVLVAGFGASGNTEVALAVAAVHRLVTIAGDGGAFVAAGLLRRIVPAKVESSQ